jgi:hypothetical protein
MGDMADYYGYYDAGPDDPMSDYYDRGPRRRPQPDARVDLQPDEWVSGDGSRIKISDMTDAHLFFSLAKGYRNEYGPRSVAQSRMPALEAEAKRRLRAKTKESR